MITNLTFRLQRSTALRETSRKAAYYFSLPLRVALMLAEARAIP